MAVAAFPRYTDCDPRVPVHCLTPDRDGCFHRFFDTSPLSPSGRYLAVTRLLHEDRLPQPGDVAEVILVDLERGTSEVIAETHGFDTQLGAQAQWGPGDLLLFNDLDLASWEPFGWAVDVVSGERRRLDGTIYMVSPDGTTAASPCLKRTMMTQAGYGVIVPEAQIPPNRGASVDDGIYVTDLRDGTSRLLVSFADIVAAAGDRLDDPDAGDFYAAHVKYNPQGTRLMLVARYLPHDGGKMRPAVVTMDADGSHARVAIPSEVWLRRGNHPEWCPDGERVLMNLNLTGDGLRFVVADCDGGHLHALHPDIPGSGHPTLHPNGRHLLTDTYVKESPWDDGTVPLRWIDLVDGTDTAVVRIGSLSEFIGPMNELRIDPHPAWDYPRRRVVFNGCDGGTRRVYLADFSALLE